MAGRRVPPPQAGKEYTPSVAASELTVLGQALPAGGSRARREAARFEAFRSLPQATGSACWPTAWH